MITNHLELLMLNNTIKLYLCNCPLIYSSSFCSQIEEYKAIHSVNSTHSPNFQIFYYHSTMSNHMGKEQIKKK